MKAKTLTEWTDLVLISETNFKKYLNEKFISGSDVKKAIDKYKGWNEVPTNKILGLIEKELFGDEK